MNILDIHLQENDADALTVRDYLKALLARLWEEEEGFSGKRPFGNSGWKSDVNAALVKAGIVTGKLDSEGYVESYDRDKADELIQAAIQSL
jgi:hypothetical protein